MIASRDIKVLKEAGIDSPDLVVSAAAAFLRAHPVNVVGAVENALSEEEEAILIRNGAEGVQSTTSEIQQAMKNNTATIAGEYAQMVNTALTQKEAADRLTVSASRIRQRIDDGTLFALDTPNGRVCPLFQFDQSSTIPGLQKVLAEIGSDAHPVVVQRFFLQELPDLVSDVAGTTLSPRDWLIVGHDVEPIIVLARDI